jgi:hypothetical protein
MKATSKSINQICADLKQAVRTYISAAVATPGIVTYLMNACPGTGKSRAVADALADGLSGSAVVWWLVPTSKKAEEQHLDYCRIRDEREGALWSFVVRADQQSKPNSSQNRCA